MRHDQLVVAVPDWKWPRYPRMYTTPSAEVAPLILDLIQDLQLPDPPDVDDFSSVEASVSLRRHLIRERNPTLTARKKERVLGLQGSLACEVCGFDFAATYGDRGAGFCEVHHRLPLGSRKGASETALEDLAVVCSNCHRMLHRGELLSVEHLRKFIQEA